MRTWYVPWFGTQENMCYMYGCRMCDFDVCERCAGKRQERILEHVEAVERLEGGWLFVVVSLVSLVDGWTGIHGMRVCVQQECIIVLNTLRHHEKATAGSLRL